LKKSNFAAAKNSPWEHETVFTRTKRSLAVGEIDKLHKLLGLFCCLKLCDVSVDDYQAARVERRGGEAMIYELPPRKHRLINASLITFAAI
jgi:hypothetical protein